MNTQTILTYAVFAFMAAMLLFIILNAVSTKKSGKINPKLSRSTYIFGFLTIITNLVRLFLTKEQGHGTMVFANIIILASLIYSYLRQNKK
ncbi:hypothetical protein [Guggenheimella bovis]